MKQIIIYLECGEYYSYKGYDFGDFCVSKFSNITEKIIPFFDKYKIIGIKYQDYLDFEKVIKLIGDGDHLTTEDLEKIIIKLGINKGRISN